jgi:cobalamin biosynthetic protein CobC
MAGNGRDHGGGLDAAAAEFGGARGDWLDLSTGINPESYPLTGLDLTPNDWAALPDKGADAALCAAARLFWRVPAQADVLAVPGCSAAIAQIPALKPAGQAEIALRSYNEHAAAFRFHGWDVQEQAPAPVARVVVHPNNPTGTFQPQIPPAPLTVIDESFCDIAPAQSHIAQATQPGHIILKSFGKFWGLAGLRLGFAIGNPKLIDSLRQRLGPLAGLWDRVENRRSGTERHRLGRPHPGPADRRCGTSRPADAACRRPPNGQLPVVSHL